MNTIKFGIICPSEIAFRRFMPALKQINGVEYIGLAVNSISERYGENLPSVEIQEKMLTRNREKAKNFVDSFGGKIFNSYEEIARSDEIDALYIPLPPALHYKWAKIALEANKHVLLEKPAAISLTEINSLVKLASSKNLALHENYMFIYHEQLNIIRDIIKSGKIGDVRLCVVKFGFPRRNPDDFRYNKILGGGAINDAGGYTIKLAADILGESAKILYSQMNYLDDFDVDIYGSGTLGNNSGSVVQIAYGMDNDYKCELEVWGSKGTLRTGRIITAPAGFVPELIINNEIINLPADDTFKKSIENFITCINNESERQANYLAITRQAELINEFRKKAAH